MALESTYDHTTTAEEIERGDMKEASKQLDLNKPDDARIFLNEALPKALPSAATHAILESGKKLAFKDMNDSEVVQYAWELLPIYQAAFPELVNTQHEH